MVSLLSLVAIAVFVSSLVVRVVRVCACARWVTLMVYFPAMALPAVVALNAVVLLVVLAALVDSCYTGDIGEPFLVVGVEVVVAVAVVVLALVVVDNT